MRLPMARSSALCLEEPANACSQLPVTASLLRGTPAPAGCPCGFLAPVQGAAATLTVRTAALRPSIHKSLDTSVGDLFFMSILLMQLCSLIQPCICAMRSSQAGMIYSREMLVAGLKPQHGGFLSPGPVPAPPTS